MSSVVRLYSEKIGEISKFINEFFDNTPQKISNELMWQKTYENPVEVADIIGTFIENKDDFDINMWVNLDDNVYINVTDNNADELIRYIFERFPY